MKGLVLAAAVAAAPAGALAQAPAPATAPSYDQAVRDRVAGRLDQAVAEFRALSEAQPRDADVWLNLGLALTAKGDLDGADAALAKGLAIAPDYKDLNVAYARVAFFRAQRAEARRRLQPALAGAPSADAQELLKQIAAADREPQATPWRVDLSTTYSRLSKDLPAWWEWDAALGRRLDSVSSLSLGIEQTRRFDVSNTYLHGEYSRRFGAWSGFVGYGGSPDAVYRPRHLAQAGVAGPALRLGQGWSLAGELDASYGVYPTGPVTSIQPNLTLAAGDRFSLGARYVVTRNERGDTLGGYTVQATGGLTRALRLTLGYGDAPDTSTGVTVKVRNYSAGLAWDIAGFTVKLAGAHEMGRVYTRDDYVVGLTRRF